MIIQVVLFVLNLVISVINYELGNYGLTMYNAIVAGLCFGFFISMIAYNKNA